ncbi:MAG TPA: protein kinase [Kofleriaceae bacterium]|nr:protein kinase [Kofleriaceae bacterium]
MTDPLIGRKLGEFTLTEQIGAGATGVVYRAMQPVLEREAAVKILAAVTPDATEAFLNEARIASGLDHPYAAHIYGFGAETDQLMWFAMELVRGTTLDRWIAERGPMPAERFLPLLERICEVVQTAHDKGIVHRDLKPANVMVISRAGRLLPKLLDLGIARTATARAEEWQGVVGTPAYMAPEQWLNASRVDARTDQYALGVTCFVVLTGKMPFPATSLIECAKQHARSPVPSLGDGVPRALDAVIARAMAKKAAERFPSLLEFAAAFRDALEVPAESEALPQLEETVRDALVLAAPQPIAESIIALEAARDTARAWKAAEQVLEVTAQYVGLVALSGLLHVPEARRPRSELLMQRLAALGAGRLDASGWLDIAREIARGFHDEPAVFPIAELASVLGDPGFHGPSSERGELAAFLSELGRVLGKLGWLSDYQIATVRRRALESWTGTRRAQRTVGHAPRDAPDGGVLLLDADGVAALTLSPLVQVARPSPGMVEEMFLFDGLDKRGPRLHAPPVGFDRHDPDLAEWMRAAGLPLGERGAGTVAAERTPYRGLATFTRDDAGWFFGREREVEAFVNRMRVGSLITVVGPSGAGKSSFVQAGVLPSLPEGTRAVTVRPGATPVAELVAKLARAGIAIDGERLLAEPGRLAAVLREHVEETHAMFVLVIDQFEELFTLGAPAAERRAYSEALVATAADSDERLRVILTLRDDFLVRAEQLPALRQRLAQGMELLTTPAPEDLQRILAEPARRVGYHFEDDELVAEMVQAVAEQPGALPLLSFTASRLWELRDVRFHTLTRRAYQTLGGVGGALAQHADETVAKLSADEQPLVREAFRHLVTSEGTRAVLTRDEAMQLLGGGPRAEAVLEQLVGSRLVVASEGEAGHERLEVAHEALISGWPRLVAWRQQDAEIVRVRDQLRTTARQWEARGRPQGLLWRDEVLAEYRLWRTRYTGAVTELEHQFGRASLALADRARRRRRTLLFSAFAVLAAGALVMTLLGVKASRSAGEAKHLLVESYFEQARVALLDGRHAEALDYIQRANAAGLDTPSLRLMAAYAKPSVGSELARLDAKAGKVFEITYSPDGARLYSAHEDGGIRVWDLATDRVLAVWKDRASPVHRLELSGDGRWLASSAEDGAVRVWDTTTGRIALGHDGPASAYDCLQIDSAHGLVVSGGDGELWIGELATGRTLHEARPDEIAACALDPRGTWIATAELKTRRVVLWSVTTGEQIAELPHQGQVNDVVVSPDGTVLATASDDGNVRTWSVPDGKLVHALPGHGDKVDRVAISPDGKRLVSIGRDLNVRVWDLATGATIYTLRGHRDLIYRPRFDHSSDRLVSTSQDGTGRLWDLRTGRVVRVFAGSKVPLYRARFAPDGKTVAAGSWDGTVAVWSTEDPFGVQVWAGDPRGCPSENDATDAILISSCPQVTRILDLARGREIELPPSNAGAVTADGTHAVIVSDRAMTAWDLSSKTTTAHAVLPAPPRTIRYAPSGAAVAIGTIRGDVLAWRLDPPGQLVSLDHHAGEVRSIAWSALGALATGDDHGELHVTYTRGEPGPTRTFALGTPITALRWSPDGARLAVGAGSVIELRDANTLAVVARLEHAGPVTFFDFDATGERLISGAQDSVARVWRVRDGALQAQLLGATAWVEWPQFVNDSIAIGTGGDGILRFWDIDREKEILTLEGSTTFGSWVIHGGLSQYGLASAYGEVIRWRLPGL